MGRQRGSSRMEGLGSSAPAVREPHGREEAPDSEGSGAFFLFVAFAAVAWFACFVGWQCAVLVAGQF